MLEESPRIPSFSRFFCAFPVLDTQYNERKTEVDDVFSAYRGRKPGEDLLGGISALQTADPFYFKLLKLKERRTCELFSPLLFDLPKVHAV